MSSKDDLAACVAALQAVAFVRETYLSGEKSAELVTEIATALAMRRSDMGKYGGICQQVADAIHRGILNHEPPPPKS